LWGAERVHQIDRGKYQPRPAAIEDVDWRLRGAILPDAELADQFGSGDGLVAGASRDVGEGRCSCQRFSARESFRQGGRSLTDTPDAR
jgi:hypothetical protein